MPLSEREIRQLREIEEALIREDPALARVGRNFEISSRARRGRAAALMCSAGLALLTIGAVLSSSALAVGGCVLALSAGYFLVQHWCGSEDTAVPSDDGWAEGATH